MKYYLCTFELQPFMCKAFKQSLVLSEHPLEVMKRTADKNLKVNILFMIEITMTQYSSAKTKNPSNDGAYVKLKREDYSEFIEDEDEEDYWEDDEDDDDGWFTDEDEDDY